MGPSPETRCHGATGVSVCFSFIYRYHPNLLHFHTNFTSCAHAVHGVAHDQFAYSPNETYHHFYFMTDLL